MGWNHQLVYVCIRIDPSSHRCLSAGQHNAGSPAQAGLKLLGEAWCDYGFEPATNNIHVSSFIIYGLLNNQVGYQYWYTKNRIVSNTVFVFEEEWLVSDFHWSMMVTEREREREYIGTAIFGKASYRNGARCLVQPTLPKTNIVIATENRPYQKGKNRISTIHFQVLLLLVSGRV